MLLKTYSYLSTAAQVYSGSSFWQTGAETNQKGLATRRATAILWCFVRHFTNWVSTWRTVTTSHQFSTEGWFRRPDSARWGSPRKIGHLVPSVAWYAAGFCVQLQNHFGISDKRDLMRRHEKTLAVFVQQMSERSSTRRCQSKIPKIFMSDSMYPCPSTHAEISKVTKTLQGKENKNLKQKTHQDGYADSWMDVKRSPTPKKHVDSCWFNASKKRRAF